MIEEGGQRKVAYGDLVRYAAELPLDPQPGLKSEAQERDGFIGQPLLRVDTPEKVDGSAIYGIDIDLPEMLIGVPWMVPDLSGKLVAVRNERQVRAMPGVVDLVLTRQWSMNNMVGLDHDMSLNTVIVVAASYWQAKKAADLLEVDWLPGAGQALTDNVIAAENLAMLDGDTLVSAVDRGEALALIHDAERGRACMRLVTARLMWRMPLWSLATPPVITARAVSKPVLFPGTGYGAQRSGENVWADALGCGGEYDLPGWQLWAQISAGCRDACYRRLTGGRKTGQSDLSARDRHAA